MRAAGMAGEFHDRDEARYVIRRLMPTADAELAKAGYKNVGTAGIGFSVIFSRTPVRTMAELRSTHPWLWSLDQVLTTQLGGMGVNTVPLPIESGGRAYDEGKVDSFIALPSAALAFQWSAQARYVTDLRVGYLTACMLLSNRAWDALSHEDQQRLQSAAVKLSARVEEAARQTDDTLLLGLFAKQGLKAVPVSPALQSEFSVAAHDAQKQVQNLAPTGMLDRVAAWILEYRNTHRGEKR
jgi:TRAP-type C4-dicarboxylate transport system substrate-binding protein